MSTSGRLTSNFVTRSSYIQGQITSQQVEQQQDPEQDPKQDPQQTPLQFSPTLNWTPISTDVNTGLKKPKCRASTPDKSHRTCSARNHSLAALSMPPSQPMPLPESLVPSPTTTLIPFPTSTRSLSPTSDSAAVAAITGKSGESTAILKTEPTTKSKQGFFSQLKFPKKILGKIALFAGVLLGVPITITVIVFATISIGPAGFILSGMVSFGFWLMIFECMTSEKSEDSNNNTNENKS